MSQLTPEGSNLSEAEADPRVRLAAERTMLAWIRTGLAMMGFGFVVARFGLFLRELATVGGVALPFRILLGVAGGPVVVENIDAPSLAARRTLLVLIGHVP